MKNKKNPYFEEILVGINEAIEFERGNITLKTKLVKVAPIERVKAKEIIQLREHLSLSQAIFAEVLGVSKKTVEAWEYGKNTPSGSSLRMLNLIMLNPELIYDYKLLSAS